MTTMMIDKESELRAFLIERPKNAKKMSQLASLLVKKSKLVASQRHNDNRIENVATLTNSNANDDDVDGYEDEDENYKETELSTSIRNEAIEWSNRAIEVAPHKPFGYAALSVAERDDFPKRMEALDMAAKLSLQEMEKPHQGDKHDTHNKNNQHYVIPLVDFYARLLLEPRAREANEVVGKIGKASAQHPNRRGLNEKEQEIYSKLQIAFQSAHQLLNEHSRNIDRNVIVDEGEKKIESSSDTFSEQQREFISKYEYKMGLFFRKKVPSDRYQPIAKNHFLSSLQRCKQHHSQNNHEPYSHETMARFWIATMGGTGEADQHRLGCEDADRYGNIDRCPANYVVGLYSTFASNFDDLLVQKLKYQTPAKLRKLLNEVLMRDNGESERASSKTVFQKGLDLGCGTGLSGMAFQDIVRGHFTGVDISPEMVEKAKERGCYQRLIVGDVITDQPSVSVPELRYANDHEKSSSSRVLMCDEFDLVIACDVFCYIGDLTNVFQTVATVMKPGGLFCFSTELFAEDTDNHRIPPEYQLQECARFAHKRSYIQRLATSHGFAVERLESDSIRQNRGEDVQGLLAILSFRRTARNFPPSIP